MYRDPDREAAIAKLVSPLTVANAVDRNAEKLGDAPALVEGARRLTWRQVKEQTERLALALLNLGVTRNDLALVQMPNGIDLYIIRVACEKAGITHVTAPITFREAELRAIVEHTRPSLALVPSHYRGADCARMVAGLLQRGSSEGLVLPSPAGKTSEGLVVAVGESCPPGVLSMSELLSRPTRKPRILRETRLGFFDIVEIQTTSGSTGVPKCVDVPTDSRALTGCIQARRYGVVSSDVVAAFTPLITGSSNALGYYFGSQLGITLVLASHFDESEALEILATEQVTVAIAVPTMLVRLAKHPGLSPQRLPSLRVIVTHGAPLAAELGREIEVRTGARIVEAYGSADYGGICATRFDDPQAVRLLTVGKALEGNDLRLVDEEGRDVPRGEVGRILVRGLHAVAGYHDNPELQASAWATGYFDAQEFGRLDDDGNLVLAGRLKDLIIRGGQNIYPVDVENLLAKHPKVRHVAVVGIPDTEYGEKVCACVVTHPGETLTLPELVEYLKAQQIARFKLPEYLELFDELPKGVGGLAKVDKARLRAIVASRSESAL
ncbi:MAG: AMP-binding protein [Chloroflexi bacterium]|nr:AMP-binding protein [Chloroflexota bacterium]